MKRGREINWMYVILVSMFIIIASGCRSSSDSTQGYDEPYEDQDISGVWVGWMGSDKDDTFAVGIITKDIINQDNKYGYTSWFIGQDKFMQYKQFMSSENSFLYQQADSAIFTGYFDDCSWNTAGIDYGTKELRPLYIWAAGATRRAFGGPLFSAYAYSDNSDSGFLVFYYNTTFDVSPDVNNLKGEWVINNSFLNGNTAVLSISPSTHSTMTTTITGSDDKGNNIKGTISIYYNPLYSKDPNVYKVNLNLNGTINLTGLAAYVLEADTLGIEITNRTLAIGATDSSKSYFFGGFAAPKE